MQERETAARLAVSDRTVRKLAASGQLERVKIGAATRYRESDVEKIIAHGTAKTVSG
jgi:excisionase family DNA binding protein